MKRLLLAAAAVAAIASGASRPAHALFGVADTCADCAKEWTQIASWAKQAKDMAYQGSQLVQANSSLTGIVSSVSGATGVDMSGLNDVRSVLSDVGEVRSAVSGTLGTAGGVIGSASGGFGNFSLSSAATAILNQNTVYRPQSGDFMAQWLNARASGQAAQQAYMQEFVKSAQARQQALLELKQRQMQARTTDERMAVQNEISRTQEELSTQEQQARSLAALGDVQERVSQQQILEKQRSDAEASMQATRAAADAVGLNPNWTGSGSEGATLAAAARPASITTVSASMAPASIPTFNASAN